MNRFKEQLPEILPLAIAIIVPLAGLVLSLQQFAGGDQRRGARILAAAILGTFAWVAILA